jgi:hypothetical protein
MSVIHRRSVLVAACGVAATLAVCGLLLDRFYSDPSFLKPHDFLQYWAAGRLNATGGNPYDADQVVELQRGAVRDEDRPTFMWNPPWVLTLAMPFGMLPMRSGQLLWLLAQLAAIVWSADAVWRCYGGGARHRPFVWAGAIVFYPVMYLLFLGQSGGWLLLGLAGFLVAATRGPLPFALLTALAAVKPHLFLPFWICLALNATRSRRDAALLGLGVLAGAAAVAVAWYVNPHVWSQYFAALARPETDAHRPLAGWQHPLIGYRLRLAIDPTAFWIQMLPAAVIALLAPIDWWRRRARWDWRAELPWLLFAGLIAAPYGAWEHDQLVLLIPVLAGFARLVRFGSPVQLAFGAVVVLAVNGLALATRESQQFIWVPPALMLWYVWATLGVRPVMGGGHRAGSSPDLVTVAGVAR